MCVIVASFTLDHNHTAVPVVDLLYNMFLYENDFYNAHTFVIDTVLLQNVALMKMYENQ